jgi:hypothetical protein
LKIVVWAEVNSTTEKLFHALIFKTTLVFLSLRGVIPNATFKKYISRKIEGKTIDRKQPKRKSSINQKKPQTLINQAFAVL